MTNRPAQLTPLTDLISLQGKCAIVTGAAQGFGYSCAFRLAEAGADVVICDIDAARGSAAKDRLAATHPRTIWAVADVTNDSQVESLMGAAVSRFGRLDILVNNAGIYSYSEIDELTVQEFHRIVEVNLIGTFLCTKMAANQMKKQGVLLAVVSQLDS